MKTSDRHLPESSVTPVVVFLLLAIVALEWLLFDNEIEAVKQQSRQQLSAIAELKTRQIAGWRAERLADGRMLGNSLIFEQAQERWFARGMTQKERQVLQHWFGQLLVDYDYLSVSLLDPSDQLLLSSDPQLQLDEATLGLMQQARKLGNAVTGDLIADQAGVPKLDIAVPLQNKTASGRSGILLVRLDPSRFLNPLIQSWPVPSDSSETLLIERRGEVIVYLNELRHRRNTVLNMTRGLDDVNLPATHAVRGKILTMEGVDYRGVPVLAATRPVPDSRWSLVVKVDTDEILIPLRNRLGIALLANLGLVAIAVGLILYFSRREKQQQHDTGRSQEMLRERLDEAQRIGRTGSWERDLIEGTLWWSEEAFRLFAVNPAEVGRLDLYTFLSRVHPDDRERVEETIRSHSTQAGSYDFAYRVLLPDQGVRHYHNYNRVYCDEHGVPVRASGCTQDVTDYREASLKLERQSAHLEAMLAHLPQGISVFDENLRLQLWNTEFREVLDLPEEAVHSGVTFEELIRYPAQRGEYGPGDPESHVQARKRLALQFLPHQIERTRPGGCTHLVRGTPFYVDGRLAGFITTYTDISERKQAEQALKHQHETLQTIMENIPGGVSLIDADMQFVAVNPEFCRLLGYPAGLLDQMPIPMLELARINAARGEYGPGDPEVLAQQLVDRAREHKAHLFERRRPDGTVLEVRGTPLPNGGFVTVHTDITARKRDEEQLQLAQRVFDNSPEAIMITDASNRIVSVNPAFTRITGFASYEVMGEDPRILASGKHDAAFYRSMWDSLSNTGHWAGEVVDRRKDGDTYPKWMTINVVRDKSSQRLTHYVALFTDITERKRAEERIRFLAHHDALTGLPNRHSLEIRLSHALAEARRRGWQVAVIFIDLDRFKTINDTLGHQVGDKLLIEVARRLVSVVRETDTVVRLGGDEFVIILPDMDTPADATTVCSKIIETMAEPMQIEAFELHTSPSIGIATCPGDGEDPDTLMKNADTAMYHAKSLGRNNFQYYAEDMNQAASERLDIEGKLRQALRRDEFDLHFQPLFGADGSSLTGVEALLRWTQRDDGAIPPSRFIPIAEDTGLIVEIGEWVLRRACHQAQAWVDAGLPSLRVAVNLSARQLRDINLPHIVDSALKESRLAPHLLELEITESAAMDRPDEAIKILHALKAMGVTLAIDDFGTGYSSLAYLKLFPIDRLKIDRSFVTDIETDPDDAAIAVSTIALAHSMGLHVIAEGVESLAQADLLRRHACDEFQGFHFGRPAPASVIEALLSARRDATADHTL